jgi:c-di-GMP-binding flagellar brake protein YcgR
MFWENDVKSSFDIELYSKMILEFPEDRERMNCRFIGLMPDEYVVVRVPLVPGIRNRLEPDSPVELRFLEQGSLVGFRTEVIAYQATPFSLMFVRYPQRLDRHELRKEKRMECRLATLISKGDSQWKGVTVDISKGGCHCRLDAGTMEKPDLKKGDHVKGAFQFIDGESQPFRATIASIGKRDGLLTLGLSFPDDKSAPPEKLYAYLQGMAAMLG